MEASDFATILAVFFIILIILFFVCRAMMLWYYKIDARLAEQKKTNMLLEQLIQLQSQGNKLSAFGSVSNTTDDAEDNREIYDDIPEL